MVRLSTCRDSDRVVRREAPRSGRQHKAWGASPRIRAPITIEPAERAIASTITAVAHSAGSEYFQPRVPGVPLHYAPGFMLTPACGLGTCDAVRSLRGLAIAEAGLTPIVRITGLDFRSPLVSLVGAVVFNDRLSRAVSPDTVPWYKVTTSG